MAKMAPNMHFAEGGVRFGGKKLNPLSLISKKIITSVKSEDEE